MGPRLFEGMWAQASRVEVGFALAGFGVVVLAYVVYAAHLLHDRLDGRGDLRLGELG